VVQHGDEIMILTAMLGMAPQVQGRALDIVRGEHVLQYFMMGLTMPIWSSGIERRFLKVTFALVAPSASSGIAILSDLLS